LPNPTHDVSGCNQPRVLPRPSASFGLPTVSCVDLGEGAGCFAQHDGSGRVVLLHDRVRSREERSVAGGKAGKLAIELYDIPKTNIGFPSGCVRARERESERVAPRRVL